MPHEHKWGRGYREVDVPVIDGVATMPPDDRAPSSTPRTEAGRDLMTNLSKVADSDSWAWWALQGIIAIEAEARAAARKEVVDELRQRLPGYMDDLNSEERSGYTFAVHQFAAILDSLSTDTRKEPTDAD